MKGDPMNKTGMWDNIEDVLCQGKASVSRASYIGHGGLACQGVLECFIVQWPATPLGSQI